MNHTHLHSILRATLKHYPHKSSLLFPGFFPLQQTDDWLENRNCDLQHWNYHHNCAPKKHSWHISSAATGTTLIPQEHHCTVDFSRPRISQTCSTLFERSQSILPPLVESQHVGVQFPLLVISVLCNLWDIVMNICKKFIQKMVWTSWRRTG